MSDETSKVQVSVNLPQQLWERLQADVRGAGQAIVDALEAHLPQAQPQTGHVDMPGEVQTIQPTPEQAAAQVVPEAQPLPAQAGQ